MKKIIAIGILGLTLAGCSETARYNTTYSGIARSYQTYDTPLYYTPKYSPNCFINREIYPSGRIIQRRVCLR